MCMRVARKYWGDAMRHFASTISLLKMLVHYALEAIRDWIDALFGFDFFVSYGRNDATGYAENLRERLAAKKLRCFLDSEDFFPGEKLGAATGTNLRKSSALVLVATAAAARSPHVRSELATFSALDRPIVVVNVNHALDQHFTEDLR